MAWVMDDHGFIRMDACTPGRTVPCGKVCRTPANCAKGKSGAERTKRIGAEALQEHLKARQSMRSGVPRSPKPIGTRANPKTNNRVPFRRQSPEEKWSSISSNPKTAKFAELITGRKLSDRKMREALGVDQEELLQIANTVYNRLGVDRTKDVRSQLKALKKASSNTKRK